MIGTILFDRPEAARLAVIFFLVTLAMVWWGDRSIRRQARWMGRSIIVVLRSATFLTMSIVLLQPVLSWTSAGQDGGVVAVLVDQSGSMSAADTQRAPCDVVAVAEALGELPTNSRDDGLSRIRSLIEKAQSSRAAVARVMSEVAYAKLAKLNESTAEQRLNKLTIEAENDCNAAIAACSDVASASLIRDVLIKSRNSQSPIATDDPFAPSLAALDQLQAQADQDLYTARSDVRTSCEKISHSSRISLVDQALCRRGGLISQLSSMYRPMLFSCGRELQALGKQSLTANEPSTNLISALSDLRRQLVGQRLAAIVLLTDGRQTESISQEFAGAGETPLFVVQVADPQVSDLAVTRLDHPSSVRVNEFCPISVDLNARSIPNAQSRLMVTARGQTQTQAVRFSRPTTQATFRYSFDHAGVADISARLQSLPDEATEKNNLLSSAIQVTGDTTRVCLIDGVMDNTANALRNGLSRMPGVEVRAFTSATGPTVADLSVADTLILHDVPVASLNDALWMSIQHSVSARGLNLLIISDSEDLFSDYQESSAIRPLLPWSDEQSPSLQRSLSTRSASIHIVPQDRAAASCFRVDDQPDQNRIAWRNLPPVSQVLTFPPPQSGSHALLIESDSHAPVLTETWLGSGRVVIFGCNEFWRWNQSTLPQSLFQNRLIDFAAGPGFVADDGELSLDVDRPLLTTELPLVIRTRMRDMTDSELDDIEEPPTLRILQGDVVISSWKLDAPMDRSNRRVQFRSPFLSAGTYAIEFYWGRHYLSLNVTVTDLMDTEMRNVSGDDALLLNLIGTNGALLKLKDLQSLKARIDAVSSPAPVVGHYRLWDSPYLFILIVGCLGLEWSLQNRWGLP